MDVHEIMKISVITPTGGRPLAFKLCELWMSRQTRQSDEWIVVDDYEIPTKCTMGQKIIRRTPFWKPGDMTLPQNLIEALKVVTGDIVIIIEDDDWYHPDYIKTVAQKFEQQLPNEENKYPHLVGGAAAIYYNINNYSYTMYNNIHPPSLCQTAFSSKLIPQVNIIASYFIKERWLDGLLWKYSKCKKLTYSSKTPLVIGIKGLSGRPGAGEGHASYLLQVLQNKTMPFVDEQPFELLEKWIGKDDTQIYKTLATAVAPKVSLEELNRVHTTNLNLQKQFQEAVTQDKLLETLVRLKVLREDFDPINYKFLNSDLQHMNEYEAIWHYIKYGQKENRKYFIPKIENLLRYKKYIDIDKINHRDILLKELSFDNIKAYDNFIILLGHSAGGGLSKYINDLVQYKNQIKGFENHVIVSNEISCLNEDILYINNKSILNFILNCKNISNNVILNVNIFPEYQSYDIDKIKNIFDLFFSKNLQVIITIHDYFYLNQKNPTMPITEFDDMTLKKSDIDTINNIFENVYQVIFPTNTCLNNYIKKGIIKKNNFIVSNHIDISYNDSIEYYNKIDDEYRILYLGDQAKHKGFYVADYLSKNIKVYNNKKIKYYYLGNFHNIKFEDSVINIGDYNYKDICKLINNIKPHLCLCLSEFYETYSYVTSIILKTGLPIFYNKDVYSERIKNRNNTYKYDSADDFKNILEKFEKCLDDLTYKGSNYHIINEEMSLRVNDFYKNEFCKKYE